VKSFANRPIKPIGVAPKLNFSVTVDPGGRVENINGDRLRQRHAKLLTRGNCCHKLIMCPNGVAKEDIHRQVQRSFNADATVAELSNRLFEKFASRGIMDVHIEVVGKHEF
jgi:hypothetical protein